jgi:N4-gp56 family major capsid protein
MTNFTPVEQYSNSDKALEGEVGKCEGVRFICTSMFDPWLAAGAAGTTFLSGGNRVTSSTACDVYPILVVAKDAYAIVPMSGFESVTPAVHNPTAVVGDELGQQGFVSWKTWQGIVILQQLFIARLECACTANPT